MSYPCWLLHPIYNSKYLACPNMILILFWYTLIEFWYPLQGERQINSNLYRFRSLIIFLKSRYKKTFLLIFWIKGLIKCLIRIRKDSAISNKQNIESEWNTEKCIKFYKSLIYVRKRRSLSFSKKSKSQSTYSLLKRIFTKIISR